MNTTIERYINSINTFDSMNFDGEVKKDFSFCGDGQGDFEEICRSAPKQVVKEYIKYCEEQIKLAKLYLKTYE
jgi:hypothetical protein